MLPCLQTMEVPGRTVEELIFHWSQTDPDTEAFVSVTPDDDDDDDDVDDEAFNSTAAKSKRRCLSRREMNVLCRKFAATLRQVCASFSVQFC